MRKPARLLSCLVVVVLAATTAAAGAASASTPGAVEAASIQSHGLGAARPARR